MRVEAGDARVTPGARLASYVTVERTWRDGDEIRLHLPLDLHYETMPDDPHRMAFFVGPTLLCVDMEEGDPVPVFVGERAGTLGALAPVPGEPLAFRTDGIGRPHDVVLRPHFAVYEGPYTVYVDALTPAEWKTRQDEEAAERARRAALDARTLDTLQPGRRASERAHTLTHSDESYTGNHQGRRWRDARNGGFLAFDLAVDPAHPVELLGVYWGGDRRRRFDVLVDDVVVGTQDLDRLEEGEFVEVPYFVPADLTRGKEKVRVTLRGHDGSHVGRVFGFRSLHPAD
jgi:hypothetical protein